MITTVETMVGRGVGFDFSGHVSIPFENGLGLAAGRLVARWLTNCKAVCKANHNGTASVALFSALQERLADRFWSCDCWQSIEKIVL